MGPQKENKVKRKPQLGKEEHCYKQLNMEGQRGDAKGKASAFKMLA